MATQFLDFFESNLARKEENGESFCKNEYLLIEVKLSLTLLTSGPSHFPKSFGKSTSSVILDERDDENRGKKREMRGKDVDIIYLGYLLQ